MKYLAAIYIFFPLKSLTVFCLIINPKIRGNLTLQMSSKALLSLYFANAMS